MKLHSLRLTNFRQHAATVISFAPGLTGIIGTNGAGKSTVLEAIAFVLYGPSAARGTKDSIAFNRAGPRAKVSAELVFELAGQTYRVARGLTSAAVYLGALDTPIAQGVSGVNEYLGRLLGMSRQEFFTTYFTGQKELAVMGAMGPAERARFLSRVLGYDRLEGAQQLVRENRKTLVADANGIRASMPDPAQLEQALRDAETRANTTALELELAEQEHNHTAEALAEVTPAWESAQAARAQQLDLTTKHGAITMREEAIARDVLRLESEAAAIAEAIAALPAMEAALATLPALREEGAQLDREAAADTERQRLIGVLSHVQKQAHALPGPDEAAQEVAGAQTLLERGQQRLSERDADVEKATRRLNEEQSAWSIQLADARAALSQARTSIKPVIARRDALVTRGPESPCTTCGVALGERYATVLAAIEEEIAQATAEGARLAAQVVALETEPESVAEWKRELQQDTMAASRARLERDELQDILRTAQRDRDESVRMAAETARIEAQIAALPTTYDHARHAIVRAELARLAPMEAQRAVLADKASGAARVHDALAQVREQSRALASERATVESAMLDLPITVEQYEAARVAYASAESASRVAFDAERIAKDAADRAADALAQAKRRIDETAEARAKLASIEAERLVVEELDRTMGDLRESLNFALRPELAEIASGLLDTLTDGRYSHAEFSEDYELTVLEDGLVKPVISGGEEDLCNLVLRLAISQMIAARAGHAFSLLILDEVFGALDDNRRANVMALLRRLGDRFTQIIVITHIGHVRDALDHVVRLEYDALSGSSRVVGDASDMAPVEDLPLLTQAAA